MSWVGALVLGFGLGVVTGMPLGVINVAIVDAVAAGRARFARGMAIGGGAADAVHAMLAFAGVAHVVTARPTVVRALAGVAAVAIAAYAIHAWRRREAARSRASTDAPRGDALISNGSSAATAPAEASRRAASPAHDAPASLRGIATALGLTLPNPAALAAWLAIAAALWPRASVVEAALVATGVGLGSALWFRSLARWIARVRADHPIRTWIPRIAIVALVALAVTGVVRTLA